MIPEPRAAEASASDEAHEQGGVVVPALVGAALSLLFIPLLMFLRDGALDLLAFILAASGGIYWGVAATASRRGIKVMEIVAGAAFVVMAMLGLWWTSLWIAAGFALHGAWDFAHRPRRIRTGIRRWFPPFCATFDWLVALYILVLR